MKTSLILAFYFFFQGEIPFKNSEEFQVQVEMKFKAKESGFRPNTYSAYGGERLDKLGKAEPFLCVNLTQLKILSDEVKMVATGPRGSIFKKKCSSEDIRLEMGFISDLKNEEGTNPIMIVFLSKEKKQLRKIEVAVLKDGTFLVNGKSHGKF